MTFYMLGEEWTRHETQLKLICEVLLYRVTKVLKILSSHAYHY